MNKVGRTTHKTDRYQFYRDQLRSARAAALADTEGFEKVIHALELIGQQESKGIESGLRKYEDDLATLADCSPLSCYVAQRNSTYHTPFKILFEELVHARNDAVHQGVHARILTDHAVDIALILEDALMAKANCSKASQFMVRDVVAAKPWHPISYVRQQMLKHSFSYLPVFIETSKTGNKSWKLISESAMAKYLRGHSNRERRRRLVKQVKDAGHDYVELILDAEAKSPDTEISDVLECIGDRPILIVNGKQKNKVNGEQENDLVGILCASDIL